MRRRACLHMVPRGQSPPVPQVRLCEATGAGATVRGADNAANPRMSIQPPSNFTPTLESTGATTCSYDVVSPDACSEARYV